MINNERIVPITAIDLISMYGVILKNNPAITQITKLDADDTSGNFTMNALGQVVIASEPVKSCNFVQGGVVYFVPAYDYTGFQINGTPTATTGVTVQADGRTLYKATGGGSGVTVEQVGF